MKFRTVKYIKAKSTVVVTRGKEVGEMGRCSRGMKLQLGRINKSRNLMYGILNIVNNNGLPIGSLMRK